MALPGLGEIRALRKRLNMTQSRLAVETGVSQSLIAKIESHEAIPSYANAKKIFDFFDGMQHSSGAKATDVMTRRVISVRTDTSIKHAIRAMEKNSVSQLPVISEGKNLGTVSEKSLLEKMNSAENTAELLGKPVDTVMEEAMPQVAGKTPIETVSQLTSHNPGVLVAEKGKITGIITKSDLLRAVLAKK